MERLFASDSASNCSGLLATCGGSLGSVGGEGWRPEATNLHLPQKTPYEAPQALRSQKEKT